MKASFITVTATIALIVIALTASCGAWGQSWSSSSTVGLTSVEWSLSGEVYTFTLTNNSGSSSSEYALLVWSLEPFRIPEPVAWTAPSGWIWQSGGHDAFTLASSSDKYSSPSALAPGESIQFTYTPDPNGRPVNDSGPQPDGIAFLSHVAAVQKTPVTENGIRKWTPASDADLGRSWHDTAQTAYRSPENVPEPSGAAALVIGAIWLVAYLAKSGRRLSDCRGVIT